MTGGFLNAVVPKTGLMQAALELAKKITANGPLATQGIIRCYRETQDMNYPEAFAKEIEIGLPIFASKDAREGVMAQKEKRKPNFPGKY